MSLADFLGWEENTVYQKDDYLYQIRNNKLYRTSLETENWRVLLDIKQLTGLQNATKVKPRFYLQLPILDEEESYLNHDKSNNILLFSTNTSTWQFQTIFTEADVMKLEEKYDTDLSYLKRIPAEDE